MDEHQENDGTLKPPTSIESTDLPVEGLSKMPNISPDLTECIPIQRLTLDQADLLRANRAFNEGRPELPAWFKMGLNNIAFQFSEYIIKNCPEGKERSQALGQVHAAKLWAVEAGIRNS